VNTDSLKRNSPIPDKNGFSAGVKLPGEPVSGSDYADGKYQVEIVSDYQSLVRLQPAWNNLMKESGIDHPFVSHEWIITWWECFGAGKSLYIVLIKSGGRIRGIVPLMISRERMYGLNVRRIGTLYNPHTPMFDFIVPRGEEGIYRIFWAHLCNNSRPWDVLELCQLHEGSATFSELTELANRDRFPAGHWSSGASPYLPISGCWDDYFKSLKKRNRGDIRRQLRRLSASGKPVLEILSSEQESGGALEEGFRIEATGWKGMAGTAIVNQPGVRRFYTRIGERMAKMGQLRLYFLSVNGRRIAFKYCLLVRNKIFLLKTGYDSEYARYSPSNLLTSLVLQDLFKTGETEYNFLGLADPWKLKWTGRLRPHTFLYIFSKTWRGVLLNTIKFGFLPKLKQIKKLLMACINSKNPYERTK